MILVRVKDTLNLGKTKFKMRGNLPVNEKKREDVWFENKVYEQRQKLNEASQVLFFMTDRHMPRKHSHGSRDEQDF